MVTLSAIRSGLAARLADTWAESRLEAAAYLAANAASWE